MIRSSLSQLALCGAIGLLASPGESQSVSLSALGSIDGPADLVRIHDGKGFVAAGRSLRIYSLDESRELEGSYTLPEEIWGFRIEGSRAYVGANFYGLAILDISDPPAPELIGSYKTPSQTKIGSAFGTKLAIIDHMEGVILVDLADEAEPVRADSYFLDGYARDVVTSGSFAYAVDSPSGLYVFDLSLPGPLEPIGTLFAASMPRQIEVAARVEEGSTLLVGAGGGNLQIFDVSDPSSPVQIATFETAGRAHRASVVGSLAFVADGERGIQVIDLSRPAEPKLVGAYETTMPARDVAADSEHVLVVVGDAGHGGAREIAVLRRH